MLVIIKDVIGSIAVCTAAIIIACFVFYWRNYMIYRRLIPHPEAWLLLLSEKGSKGTTKVQEMVKGMQARKNGRSIWAAGVRNDLRLLAGDGYIRLVKRRSWKQRMAWGAYLISLTEEGSKREAACRVHPEVLLDRAAWRKRKADRRDPRRSWRTGWSRRSNSDRRKMADIPPRS